MAGIWWMVFGYALGKVVDAYLGFEPEGAVGGGGGGGVGGGTSVCNYVPGYGVRCH
jgi:hypothetical protein